jgi:hypothetical protein
MAKFLFVLTLLVTSLNASARTPDGFVDQFCGKFSVVRWPSYTGMVFYKYRKNGTPSVEYFRAYAPLYKLDTFYCFRGQVTTGDTGYPDYDESRSLEIFGWATGFEKHPNAASQAETVWPPKLPTEKKPTCDDDLDETGRMVRDPYHTHLTEPQT